MQGAAHEQPALNRCLSVFDLILLGIGAIIGAGIFVLTGIAAATQAGPAIILSYVVAGVACIFSALSYAELAASVGGCGSAYGYAYVGFGKFIAWIIGWDLLLEYGVACSAVALGWSSYVENALQSIGVTLPAYLVGGPLQGGYLDLPAVAIILTITLLLSLGVKESARANAVMVLIKCAAIFLFIVIASQNISLANWHPFMPFGWSGVMSGAAFIFFAYIGFDAVSTAAEEAKNPQRDLPRAIIYSLLICTIIYMTVAGLLTLMVPYQSLNMDSPVAYALLSVGHRIAGGIIAVGAIAGLTTVILVMFFGLSRIFLAMARDRLLPSFFATVHPRTRTPVYVIVLSGIIIALIAGLLPMRDIAELVNIGTLAAFVLVNGGVLMLRYTRPDMPRPFRMPGAPLTPILGIVFCLYLMISLSWLTWLRFVAWLAIGLAIYFFYGRHRSVTK